MSRSALVGCAASALAFFLLTLNGCDSGNSTPPSLPSVNVSPFGVVKTGATCLKYTTNGAPSGPVESTPIEWGGQVLLVTGNSHSGVTDGSFRVDTFDCKTSIASVPALGFHYMNALVNGDTLYLFGAVNGSTIQMVSSNDPALQVWTSPQTVLTMPVGMGVFNTSISASPTGFVMALEVKDKSYPEMFVTHFARSTDLQSWSLLSNVLRDTSGVTNCPWIWFDALDGNYYVMYLNQVGGQGETLITRSADLTTWSMGKTAPFIAATGEGNNNSDVAALEFNGYSYFVYARGDQTSWLNLATGNYAGTLDQFVHLFF